MKVLLVTTIFPPEIGGPATFIDVLGAALSRQGDEVTVICASKAASDPTDEARPFRVVRIPVASRVRFEVGLRAALAREALRHKLILANGLYEQVWQVASKLRRPYAVKIVGDYAWEMARNMGVTNLSIDDFQGRDIPDAFITRIRRDRDNYLRGAAKVIVPSDYLNRMVRGWGVPAEKVSTVLNGVQLEHFYGSRPAPHSPAELLNVAFVGRLTNWKGVETLLLSLKQARGVRLTVIGDGPEMPMLTALAAQLELGDKARFAGRLTPEEVRRELSLSHALALPSLYEGLSHTLLEACASGLPCIASECGGNTEVVSHGENGLLVPYGDVGAMTKALETLRDDEPARLRYAAAAAQTAAKFTFDNTVKKTIEILCG